MKNIDMKPTIGMEIHCELRTKSKLFCGCPADHFAKEPNTQTCPVCLGLPGELPVTNKKAVEWTILMGLAVNSRINREPKFDRKHYFYPDLPMGFQISQYDEPFCIGGFVDTLEGRVDLTRIHLEIDTGKLQHSELDGEKVSLIDFNRSGVALMEIVSEPDIKSGSQAREYAKNIQQIIRYLGISDCDMEKGSMRLEANISWGLDLGYKVEVKNLNSFRFLEKAINYELERQKKMLDKGEKPIQETRGWDQKDQKTFSQRTKETAEDYRYFPDPDLPPMRFSDKEIKNIKNSLPELPGVKKIRFVRDYGISDYFAEILTDDRLRAEYYENAAKLAPKLGIKEKIIADLMVNKNLDKEYEEPELMLKKLLELTQKETVTGSEVENAVSEVIREEVKAVDDYKSGKTQVMGYLLGQVQKKLKGKGETPAVIKALRNKL